jgi:hypothetical protein
MGLKRIGLVLLAVVLLAGCSLSPEEKVARERALQQSIKNFIDSSEQSNWEELYRMSAGKFKDSDKLKEHLMMARVPNATLTGGVIASMAWEDNKTAIVKINWSFQAQSVQSLTSETTIWVWKGKNWRYLGRALR